MASACRPLRAVPVSTCSTPKGTSARATIRSKRAASWATAWSSAETNQPASQSAPTYSPTIEANMNVKLQAAASRTLRIARRGSPAPRNWPTSVPAAT